MAEIAQRPTRVRAPQASVLCGFRNLRAVTHTPTTITPRQRARQFVPTTWLCCALGRVRKRIGECCPLPIFPFCRQYDSTRSSR